MKLLDAHDFLALRRFWILCFFSIIVGDSAVAKISEVSSSPASINLSEWDGDSVIRLDGPWDFYWQKFLDPDEPWQVPDLRMKRIEYWQQKQLKDEQVLEPIGYGTYQIELNGIRPRPGGYALLLTGITSSAKVIVFEQNSYQELIRDQVGEPQSNSSSPSRHPLYLHFNFKEEGNIRIVVQVANHHTAWGGIWKAPTLGPPALLRKSLHTDGVANAASMGIALAVCFYSGLIFWRRRQDYASLYLAFFSLTVLLRSFTTANFIAELLPENYFQLLLRLEFVTITAGGVALVLFLRAAFFAQTYRLMYFAVVFSGAGLMTISLLTPPTFYDFILTVLQLHLVSCCIAATWLLGHAFLMRQEGAILVLSGISLAMLGAIYDIFIATKLINGSFYIAPITSAVFLLIQSQLVARRTAAAYKRSEQLTDDLKNLSKNLQIEVKKQTKKLELQRDRLIEQKKELSRTHEDLKKLDVQKTRFFQNISHELRTPLTLILASQKSLLHRFPEEEDLSIAERNGRRLLRLVNQLLDFQKITQSEQNLCLKRIQIVPFMKHCAEYFKNFCDSKQIKLNIKGMEDDKALILSQVDALEKVIFNYLSNALKYTPVGGHITLGIQRQGLYLRVFVKDSGPGIAASDQLLLFQLFSQVDDSDRRSHEGTGLGLALVKELVTKMEGTVGVESEPGRGACFWAEFPIADETVSLQLLVVDPDESTRELLTTQLTQLAAIKHYKILASAEEALPYLKKYRINLVLTDAVLPGMDGPSFLEEVVRLQPKAHRLLMTSRKENHGLVQNAINAAIVEKVFYKPLGNEIYSIVNDLAQRSQNMLDKKTQELLLVDDDPQILKSLVTEIRNSTLIEQIQIASDVKEAMRILQENRFKLVISDADLGESESGADLLAYLFQTEPETQRILLTAEKSSSVLEEAINRGKIHHIFYKPIEFETLLPIVQNSIARSKIEPEQADNEAQAINIKDWHLAGIEIKENFSTETDNDSNYEELGTVSEGTIVVCDDVSDMRQLISRCLQKSGYRVIGAFDGHDGYRKIEKLKPDLVVIDWMMPHLTGPELIAKMHGNENLVSIPTILLTAKSDEESKMIGAKGGATAYLSKPFDEMELLTMVKNLIDLKAGEKKIAELNRYLTEKVLCRFLPPKLVEQVVQGTMAIDHQPSTLAVTILFADICGFTKLSEDLGPQRVSKVLNQFLESMSRVIFEHNGTIDKFIGDAIMAIFGAPEQLSAELQIQQACQCAIKMHHALEKLKQTWRDEDEFSSLQMRIGMHHGPAVVGQFGSELRSEYTAIGPTVNYAARVQDHASPGSIFISASIRDYLSDGWQRAGSFDLKGIGKVNLYQIDLKRFGGKNEAA
ncbi:MAG: response regulator [Oligoflexus sp.]